MLNRATHQRWLVDKYGDTRDNLKPFPPGVSGNPGGRPVAARTRLTAHYLNALADDFAAHGKKAIVEAREKDPVGYIKVIAALMPKQIEQSTPLEDVSDAELLAGIAMLRARLTDGSGAGAQSPPEPSQAN